VDLLTLLIVILIVAWVLGGAVIQVGPVIHLLLIIVAILIIVRVSRGERL
jgi:hypothetical protein